ncbi:hypothetical protein DESPIG_02403, partial [Desulfovibrio piger ATCC 29098]
MCPRHLSPGEAENSLSVFHGCPLSRRHTEKSPALCGAFFVGGFWGRRGYGGGDPFLPRAKGV